MSVDQLMVPKVDRVVDVREIPCPGPLLEAKRAMGLIPMDGVIEIVTSDIATTLDIPAWASKVGHQYLGMLSEPGIWKLYVQRRK